MVIDLQPAVTPSAVSPRAQFRRPSVAKRVAVTILRSIGIFVPVFVIIAFITFSLREISGLSPAYLQAGTTPRQNS